MKIEYFAKNSGHSAGRFMNGRRSHLEYRPFGSLANVPCHWSKIL